METKHVRILYADAILERIILNYVLLYIFMLLPSEYYQY